VQDREKVRTGQDRTRQSKKSHYVVIFHLFGEKPPLYRLKPKFACGYVITCAKFQNEIFRGYDFTGVRISHFLLIFAWALYNSSATALTVMVHQRVNSLLNYPKNVDLAAKKLSDI